MENLKKYICEINNFPREGIAFKDINPIYKEPRLWNELMSPLQKLVAEAKPDYIAGIDARGFISAAAIAFKSGIGFIPIRKPNKLPGKVIGFNYKLEYGEDRLEIQKGLFKRNSRIMIIDDLLATGGTASAASNLIRKAGGNLIGFAFLVELTELRGRKNLDPKVYVESVIKF